MMVQQENTGENLCGIELGQDFFNRIQKHEPSKKRLLKWTSVLRACALQKARLRKQKGADGEQTDAKHVWAHSRDCEGFSDITTDHKKSWLKI